MRFLDLDPAQAAALALADNKLGEIARWDETMLANVLAELEAEKVDLDGLGFTDQELDDLFDYSFYLVHVDHIYTRVGISETIID